MRNVYSLTVILFVFAVYGTGEITQTDWSGGPGIPGPVLEWGTEFSESSSLDYSYSGNLYLTTSFTAKKYSINTGSSECSIAIDFDGDGDLDVCCSGLKTGIRWIENTNGHGTHWETHSVSPDSGIAWVAAMDVDCDGDMDLISANSSQNQINWWENTEGSGTSWTKQLVASDIFGVQCVTAVDLDGNGVSDLLAAAENELDVIAFINTDGSGTNWSRYSVGSHNSAYFVASADVDGDGFQDAVAANDWGVTWFRNDGSGTSWTAKQIFYQPHSNVGSFSVADMDNDGDLDIVIAAAALKISWFENVDGSGSMWIGNELEVTTFGATAVAAGDFDFDGHMDIAASYQDENAVFWYSRLGGTSMIWVKHDVDNPVSPRSLTVSDMNSDGYPDLLGSCYTDALWWHLMWEPLSGSLVSSIFAVEGGPVWEDITWSAHVPVFSSLSFQVRSSADSTDMGDWSAHIDHHCSLKGILDDGDHYMQYKVIIHREHDDVIPYLESISVSYLEITNITPAAYLLLSPSPNPSTGTTIVSFDVPLPGHVTIRIYDIFGRIVDTPFDGNVSTDRHQLSIQDLLPGLYFVRMEAGFFNATEALVVIEAGD